MENLREILEDIKNKKNKEILSSLGRGVFVKAKIISDDILIEIGNKSLITKTIPETKELIEEQIKKIEENKAKLNNELKNVEKEMENFFIENRKECKCTNEENCKCGKKK
jgi:prefoldin alpha subunit